MPAYMIINANIHNPALFREYARRNAELVNRLGGRYLAVAGQRDTLEGNWPEGKAVISEWPSREHALAYWHSPEYREIRKLREGICDAHVLLVDGLPSSLGGEQ